MCLGIPMRILDLDGASGSAVCESHDGGALRTVNVALLDVKDLALGTQLLIHGNTAIRILDADEARLLEQALLGLEAANDGRPVDAFFADLISREPELPAHLRKDPQS